MDPDKIPAELKLLRQWVPFRIDPPQNGGLPVKVPLIAGTNRKASPTDPSTWTTFDEAMKHGLPAFCLTKDDPYIMLDLDGKGKHPIKDELAEQLLDYFPGYQEWSVSGSGAHIFVSGRMNCDHGLHRDGVEVYSHSRFCIMTGDCLPGCETILDADSATLAELELQMQAHGIHVPDMTEKPETESDEDVLTKCRDSRKFCELWEGKWQERGYPSQSEADLVLVGMIAAVTESNEQTRRLFLRSGLYRPDKPHKFRYALRRIRAQQERDAENAAFVDQLLSRPPEAPEQTFIDQNDPRIYELPEGLMSELFHAYQAWSYYPLREASLMAALVTALALFQRQYQTPTGLALNMMLFLTGPAGSGKETISKGPRRLFKEANAPMQGVFGGELRSLPAVEDALKGSIRHMAYHNECASWLKAMCEERASPSWQQLRSKLTDVFTKGADVWSLRQTKVQKGDSKEYELERPCLTVFGDCVTNDFYEAIGTKQISGGFIPRLSVMEVDRDSISVDTGEQTPFTPDLLQRIRHWATEMMMADTGSTPVQVAFLPEAKKRFKAFNRDIRKSYAKRDIDKSSLRDDLKGRIGEKVVKLATLLGVCRNPLAPCVALEDVEWSILFVKVTDGRLFAHLMGGEHDTAMHQQRKQVQRCLDEARHLKDRATKRYFSTGILRDRCDLIPWGWLSDRASRLACFNTDRRGAHVALFSVLKDLEASGECSIVNADLAMEKFGTRSVVVVNLRTESEDLELF